MGTTISDEEVHKVLDYFRKKAPVLPMKAITPMEGELRASKKIGRNCAVDPLYKEKGSFFGKTYSKKD